MKRGAEKQISKDDGSDDEEGSGAEGFRKADEAVLATRKIRSLPKRSLAGTPPPATNGTSTPEAPSTPQPKFGGFSGFGSPSSSFSFTPPATTTSKPTTQLSQTLSSFGAPSSLSSGPSIALNASNTAKTFASFLGDSSPKPSNSTPAPPTPQPVPSPPLNQGPQSAAVKYYTSLRGLNVSILTAISKAVEDDPFVNVAELLERYKSLRLTLQREFDSTPATTAGLSSPSPNASSPAPLPAMPAPPSLFSGFGSSSPLPTPTTSSGGPGAEPASTAPSSLGSGFSFATPPVPVAPPPAPPTSVFGSSSSSSSFGVSTFGTSGPSPFGKSASAPSPFALGGSSPSKPDSGTSVFGGASSPSNVFGNAGGSSSATNVFGTPTSSSITAPGAFGGFGGFGKKSEAGSIGNPVGFGFGGPPKTAGGSTAPPTGSGTGFSWAPVADKKTNEGGLAASGDTEGEGKAEGGSSLLVTSNAHDEEGEGEEDEETVHAIKLKAYRMKKAEEKGGTGWVELGVGTLRLKKHKETGARRMLLRNSSTGKININFNIYSGLSPSQTKKTLTFVGHGDGASQTYSVRLPGEEQAKQLKDAIDREIAFVKAKSDN